MATMTIGEAIGWLAAQDPDRPAITHEDRTVTRLELDLRTNRLARAYAELGVGRDDLVTIGLPNGIEFFESAIAVWKLGATPQPVSSRLPGRERSAIIELANPPLVVGVSADELPEGSRARAVPAGFEADPALSDGPLPPLAAASWKAPTSGGSTGRPKLILAGTPATIDPEKTMSAIYGMQLNGVNLVPGPLYHNGPFLFSTGGLFCGNHLIVMTRFDASKALELIERHRVEFTLLVPTMMLRIWRLPTEERLTRDVSSLRGILHLAAPCPPWLKEAWIDWLGPDRIWELYAGTEAQGVTIINGREWLEHRGSVGRPVGSEMQILDADTGAPLPAGEVGEIWMRPPPDRPPSYRYIGAVARERDGWESLGDMGWMDEDGYLYIADRRADMILAGGANIYPAEVEAALDEHPHVLSCAVIGIPDEDMGNRIHAVVQTVSGAPIDEGQLRSFLTERLVSYKVPRSYEFTDQQVRDDAGKVRRSELSADRASPTAG